MPRWIFLLLFVNVIEKIEDEYDLALFNKVWEEEKEKERFSHEKVKKELGL